MTKTSKPEQQTETAEERARRELALEYSKTHGIGSQNSLCPFIGEGTTYRDCGPIYPGWQMESHLLVEHAAELDAEVKRRATDQSLRIVVRRCQPQHVELCLMTDPPKSMRAALLVATEREERDEDGQYRSEAHILYVTDDPLITALVVHSVPHAWQTYEGQAMFWRWPGEERRR